MNMLKTKPPWNGITRWASLGGDWSGEITPLAGKLPYVFSWHEDSLRMQHLQTRRWLLNRYWVWWIPIWGSPASGNICSIYFKATQLFIPSYSSLNMLIQALWFQGPHAQPLLFPNNRLEKPYTCGYCAGNWRLRAGEIVIPREERTSCLSDMKWAALKTHIRLTLNRRSRLYLCMYMNICVLYIYVINIYAYTHMKIFVWSISKKRDREFEREQGGVYGRLWREGEMMLYIIISNNKNNNFKLYTALPCLHRNSESNLIIFMHLHYFTYLCGVSVLQYICSFSFKLYLLWVDCLSTSIKLIAWKYHWIISWIK